MSAAVLKDKNVAVLMGGPSAEREVSLRSGAAVAKALRSLGANVTEVDVQGPDFLVPEGADLAYIMLHGTFGEDGQIQAILEERGIPYTGEGVIGSQVAFDKILSKERFDEAGVPTPGWRRLVRGQSVEDAAPFVIKAPKQGSSVGVHIIKDTADVPAALTDCFQFGEEVLFEEFCTGRELTIGILGGEALPIIEIVPNEGFYDYAHKYTKGASQYHVPAPIAPEATERVQAVALAAYKALGLEVYARVDVLLKEDGSPVVLEINTIPGMTETSLLPKAAGAVGIDFPTLCDRIADLSLKRFSA
jgi:D-alanine-D-alanine ligase